MPCEIFLPAGHHPICENARQSIEQRSGTLAALLLLAGISPLRWRAVPEHRMATHSAASNRRV
jgi:hypothetical protein